MICAIKWYQGCWGKYTRHHFYTLLKLPTWLFWRVLLALHAFLLVGAKFDCRKFCDNFFSWLRVVGVAGRSPGCWLICLIWPLACATSGWRVRSKVPYLIMLVACELVARIGWGRVETYCMRPWDIARGWKLGWGRTIVIISSFSFTEPVLFLPRPHTT